MNFQNLKSKQGELRQYTSDHTILSVLIFSSIYILSVALSFPGATILTLAAGAIFGLGLGTLIVSFSSSLGATANFLISRYLLRDTVEKKFPDKLKTINKGIREEGSYYLFTLRMLPVFPFFLINLTMGLTEISVFRFFWVSQVGMLSGTLVYVNAGTQLSLIQSPSGIFSIPILLSFSLLGLFPLLAKIVLNRIRRNRFLRKFRKPKSFDYNLISIGAGAAGLVSSYIGATVRAKVAIVERNKMGGDCLNTGCVPSKALIASAKKVHLSKTAGKYGLDSVEVRFSFPKIMNRIQKVIRDIEPHDSIERYTGLGVECHTGEARIKSPYEVEINGKVYTTESIIIATGAEPIVPKIPGLEKVPHLTSETLWKLEKLPERLLVIGGGPIGCEMAQSFSRLGSKVQIIEMASRLLGKEDIKISEGIQRIFEKEGIGVHCESKAALFSEGENGYVLECESKAGKILFEFDQVILALGRRARTKGFGLEELGIEIKSDGSLEVDEFMATKYPNIFACGDVVGAYQFTHTASHQAWYASVNALFGGFKKFKADYRVIPRVTFTDPEVATVGLTESELIEQGLEFESYIYELSDLDRAIAEGETEGFLKVLTMKNSDKILGVSIFGFQAGEMISEFVFAMKYNHGLNEILGTIHAYPTMSEANKYLAGVWKKAHAPQKALQYLEKYHKWKRRS
ncbi:MAG: FAD-dependent oxidoreductase [Leptospiraceae bacterium]|nr:FAD-dependent oxidoreductase [Leptospiraceae bacterium]